MHFPFRAAACGLGGHPSFRWPHQNGVGHAKWHRARSSALIWKDYRSHIHGWFQDKDKFLLLQNYFLALLSKFAKGTHKHW